MSKHLPATQDHLDIVDIIDKYVILKTGACVVIQPAPVNFDLLSEREQDALINAFAGLLNSLTFPIQVIVRTRRIDISNYLSRLETAKRKQTNPYLKTRIESYKEYITRLTSRKDILDKKFYVVVPYTDYSLKSSRRGILPGRYKKIDTQRVAKKARDQLAPKIEHIVGQLGRLGVNVRVLEEEKLVELFYNIYNPGVSHSEHVTAGADDYTSPFVESTIENES